MKIKWKLFGIIFVLFVSALTRGESAMADTILYRVSLATNKNHTITVKQLDKTLTIALAGFGKPIELKANGGGTSTCRTIIEHNSVQATVLLSLPIPDPRAPCRSLPGFISIKSKTYNISIDEEAIKKLAGANSKLRNTVNKILGKIEEGEG